METKYFDTLIANLGLQRNHVKNTMELLQGGATIPFIARYRKELTGSMDEVDIQRVAKEVKYFEELEARKIFIIDSIESQGKMTDQLLDRIQNLLSADELEDIYLPYKRKKKSRADVARDQGLEPLANIISEQREHDISRVAQRFVTELVPTVGAAIQGALDIIAEWVSEDQEVRDKLRHNVRRYGVIHSKVAKNKADEGQNYKDYFQWEENLAKCPSHRYLAMMRGQDEGFLKLHLAIDKERFFDFLHRRFIKYNSTTKDLLLTTIEDAYDRLLFPSIENQLFGEFKEKADDEAIRVFSTNLFQLLMAAPLGKRRVLALDPGFRTGCKMVCLDEKGDLVYNTTIYPNAPQNDWHSASNTVSNAIFNHKIDVVAIGNGTASRETQSFVESLKIPDLQIFMVSENGASIYSASDVARQEFPDLDLTVRGAISIGRRLMDPLAELVKIDAKSIGVGQYQHDVNQTKLKESLDTTVISCVNKVGVNLNTASEHLLMYVSGLGPALAKNIVAHRQEIQEFKSRDELKKVKRLGDKAFEQAAGFLRIRDGENPLDNTGVHPESYTVVKQMAKDLNTDINSLIQQKELRKKIEVQRYVTKDFGLPTLNDILKELDKPGLDPRGEAKAFGFADNIRAIDDLEVDMVVPGIVTNLTNFGAFVDIGVKQDGLVHISMIADKFIANPAEVLALNQVVTVKIIEVDVARKRINLSMKGLNPSIK